MATFNPSIEQKPFTNDALIIVDDDTQWGFGGTLHKKLQELGFRSVLVRDGHELGRKDIEESMVVIPVFSKGLVSSPDLLEELAVVFNEKRMCQLFLPFLYKLEYKDMLYLTCGKLWKKFMEVPTKVTVLDDGCLFGDGVTCEHQCIDKIVQVIAKHSASTIGLIPRVKEMMALLPQSDSGVNVVGVVVPGKETITRNVYEVLAPSFPVHCYLPDVGEKIREHGPQYLQNKLVPFMDEEYMMFGNSVDTVGSDYNIINMFENFQEGVPFKRHKKVLAVLDGIDCPYSLNAALGFTPRFAPGSQVLIIAPHIALLENSGIEKVYEVKGLDKTSAYQVLCLEAFGSMNMSFKYMDIIMLAETCAYGNPCALKAIGSCFRGKTVAECEIALDEYKRIQNAGLIESMIGKNNQSFGDISEEYMEYDMPDVEAASDD